MLRIKVLNQRVTKVRTEVLVLGIFQDVRPLKGLAGEVDWIHCGILSRLILSGRISGKIGESTLLATQHKLPTSKVLVMGLGELAKFNHVQFQRACESAFKKLIQLQAKHCVMELFGLFECGSEGGKSVMVLMDVIKQKRILKDLDLFLLVPDERKASQVEQQLTAITVPV